VDSRTRNTILVVVIPLLAGIGLPPTGLITSQYGTWLVAAAIVLALTVVVTPVEYRVRHAALDRLPFGFRSPVYRKPRVPKQVRPPAALGALDFELRTMQATERFGKVLGHLTKNIQDSGNIAAKYGPRLENAANASTEEKIRLSRAYAREQRPLVEQMEKREQEYAQVTAELTENGLQRLKAFPSGTDLAEVRGTFATLAQTVAENKSSLGGFRSAVAEVRANNLQQSINETADRQMAVTDGLLRNADVMAQYCRDALAEMDGRASRGAGTPAGPRTRRQRLR
jgi:hypothetical protein